MRLSSKKVSVVPHTDVQTRSAKQQANSVSLAAVTEPSTSRIVMPSAESKPLTHGTKRIVHVIDDDDEGDSVCLYGELRFRA